MRRSKSGGKFWAYHEYEFVDDMLGPFSSAAKARSAAKKKYPDAERDEIKVTKKGPTASEEKKSGGLLGWFKGLFA